MDERSTQVRRRVHRSLLVMAAGAAVVVVVGLIFARGLQATESIDAPVEAPFATGDTSRLSDWPVEPVDPAPAVDAVGPAVASPLERLFSAIRLVESVGGRRPVGDRGRSLGEYHITRRYWDEAAAFGGSDWDYDTRVWSGDHCRQVMRWYWQRWCPDALAAVESGRLREGDLETLARIHNGGPRGAARSATDRYWRRVRDAMND